MKYVPAILLAIIVLIGCKYEAPLSQEHTVAIDPSLLGVWEPVLDEGEEASDDENMIVLRYSDTEYFVRFGMEDDQAVYFRAYPIKIAGLSCIQLEMIGSHNGPIEKDEKKLFDVVSCALADGELEVKVLNARLVSDNLKSTKALQGAFSKRRNEDELFWKPTKYKKARAED